MSRASMRTCWRTSAASRAAAADGDAKRNTSARCGSVSMTSRWSVQSPPLTIDEGMSGSGTSEPNAPPPTPANSNAVT